VIGGEVLPGLHVWATAECPRDRAYLVQVIRQPDGQEALQVSRIMVPQPAQGG
jgi:hypothetical protein